MLQRRQFIKSSLTAFSGLALIESAFSQTGLSVQAISEDMLLIRGAGENIIATQGRQGLMLIDGGNQAFSQQVLTTLETHLGTQIVNHLLNTHWHPQQTGLNQLLGSSDTEIIAHENTRLWLSTETIVRWQDKVYQPVALEAQPTTTFIDDYSFQFDGEQIACSYLLQAHTDGDICIHFPERNIMAVGGAVSTDSWPLIDWSTAGWIGGMLKSVALLIAQADDSTIIIPATGQPTNKAELIAQHTMYEDIMGKLKIMMESGYDISKIIAEKPAEGYKPEWGNSDQFLSLAFRSFWGHVRQFDVV